ncbi:unnamed protein product [Cuscuta campestris]|uniref:Uncharacterized protein n=1 Tax=Cuscuta campestris TaxID=132261 RepID=A0A484KRI1_9ASTE|nr:unnamed protein product [Cuscuta campestris]
MHACRIDAHREASPEGWRWVAAGLNWCRSRATGSSAAPVCYCGSWLICRRRLAAAALAGVKVSPEFERSGGMAVVKPEAADPSLAERAPSRSDRYLTHPSF